MYQKLTCFYLSIIILISPVLNAPFFNIDQRASSVDGGAAAQEYGHMAKKLMNDFFEEDKIKPEEEASNEKSDFGTSEEIMKDDGTEQKKMESKVALFFHVLIEILKEIFEDTNVNKNSITKIGGPIQKVKIAETPLTTVRTEEKTIVEATISPATTESTTTESTLITEPPTTISTTTVMETTVAVSTEATNPITTTSNTNDDLPHLSKINIPKLPTEATMPEEDTVATPTSTVPLISFEVPEIQTVTESPTTVETTTVSPTDDDTVAVVTTPLLISFEVPKIPKLNIPAKEIPEVSTTVTSTTTTTTTSTTVTPPPTEPSTSTTTTTTPLPSTPSTTQEMHYDDTDDNGIPFWLKVIDGIRCSMRDCSGVLIPTRSPYEQKELKNLTMTRFIREHGLPPCPCLELKELQKVLSSSNKDSSKSQR